MLPKRPNYKEYEPRLYQTWEEKGYFTPKIDPDKKPYTILLPPPNANAPLHAGHAMYLVEDILCRYHRMRGRPTLFLPGTDHAGIETQFVFEKKLAKQGKSRLDYDRQTLYKKIKEFVQKNRGTATDQLRKLGFSLDWTREKYTLDPEILETVFKTFRTMHDDNLIYRDERLVNYCTQCGTGFSNLEIDHIDRTDKLFYLDYGPLSVATTRPETIFADVAVAVHPDDKRYQNLVGQSATIPLLGKEIPIIAHKDIDPEFGTGALKITPGHAKLDYQIGEDLNLKRLSVINRDGRMQNLPSKYQGLSIQKAREQVVKDLRQANLLDKKEPYQHTVAVCYRCNTVIEPLLLPQWYVKIAPLVKQAVKAVQEKKLTFFPKRFKKEMLHWLKTAPDWNISRQIVWGPRIPAWYCLDCNPEIEVTFLDENRQTVQTTAKQALNNYSIKEIKSGLQNLIAPTQASYQLSTETCKECQNTNLLQETDTFDTWFSSGQWPLSTLGYPADQDFNYFYPTSLIDTMWDILPFWIMRMLMLGLYRADKVPFKQVHLHSRVVDGEGKKMSKSRGNVINPLDLAEEYGTDALRLALVFGTSPASDIPVGKEKLRGMRNFVTKLWNVARFILMTWQETNLEIKFEDPGFELSTQDEQILAELDKLVNSTSHRIRTFEFGLATEEIYNFVWNRFASQYLEDTKDRKQDPAALYTLLTVLRKILKLLHPFIPYVTEEIYLNLPNQDAESINIAPWPQVKKR